jgi:hypothetical protein
MRGVSIGSGLNQHIHNTFLNFRKKNFKKFGGNEKCFISLAGGWVCSNAFICSFVQLYVEFFHNIALEIKKVYNIYVYCISLYVLKLNYESNKCNYSTKT